MMIVQVPILLILESNSWWLYSFEKWEVEMNKEQRSLQWARGIRGYIDNHREWYWRADRAERLLLSRYWGQWWCIAYVHVSSDCPVYWLLKVSCTCGWNPARRGYERLISTNFEALRCFTTVHLLYFSLDRPSKLDPTRLYTTPTRSRNAFSHAIRGWREGSA